MAGGQLLGVILDQEGLLSSDWDWDWDWAWAWDWVLGLGMGIGNWELGIGNRKWEIES